jgi:hypothetical protein
MPTFEVNREHIPPDPRLYDYDLTVKWQPCDIDAYGMNPGKQFVKVHLKCLEITSYGIWAVDDVDNLMHLESIQVQRRRCSVPLGSFLLCPPEEIKSWEIVEERLHIVFKRLRGKKRRFLNYWHY